MLWQVCVWPGGLVRRDIFFQLDNAILEQEHALVYGLGGGGLSPFPQCPFKQTNFRLICTESGKWSVPRCLPLPLSDSEVVCLGSFALIMGINRVNKHKYLSTQEKVPRLSLLALADKEFFYLEDNLPI